MGEGCHTGSHMETLQAGRAPLSCQASDTCPGGGEKELDPLTCLG
jgi:hypothetical protein